MTNNISIQPPDILSEQTRWRNIVNDILKQAKSLGATSAEVSADHDIGFSVTVRMGEVETVEYNRDKGVGITVYFGQRAGSASSTDTSPAAIKTAVEAACRIARLANEDPYAGLADAKQMATHYPDLDLYYPWPITAEQAIEMMRECEALGRSVDKRIENSEGASLNAYQGLHVYGNSHGFIGSYAASRHSYNCALVAKDANGMQRDAGYSMARDPADLDPISKVAREAASRTLGRLNARRLKTQQAPVLFQAEVARGIIKSFLGAISGGNLYRKSSFLVDHLDKPVFAKHLRISDNPNIKKGLASTPFDAEGVRGQERDLVVDGVLQGYLLGSYSARKLGMQTTGNAGGSHNIFINTSDRDLEGMLKLMGKGLLVTEVMGQGVNLVTGDYSRGAVGFWVENGAIQYPVEEITIAGNLRDMFKHLVAVGNDVDKRSHVLTGSILVESMMIAGE